MATNEAESPRQATFTLPELAELTGIDSRTLHNWMRRDVLAPSYQHASGSGTKNLFDRRLGEAAPDAKVILFGSRAKGDPRPDSGLD